MSASAETDTWLVWKGEETIGPYRQQTLIELVRTGEIPPSALARRETDQDFNWRPIAELFDVRPPVPTSEVIALTERSVAVVNAALIMMIVGVFAILLALILPYQTGYGRLVDLLTNPLVLIPGGGFLFLCGCVLAVVGQLMKIRAQLISNARANDKHP